RPDARRPRPWRRRLPSPSDPGGADRAELGGGRQPLHGALVRADPQLDGNRGNARLGPGRPRLSLRERNGPGVTLQEGGGEEDRSASRSGAHLPETGVAGRLAVRQLVAPTPSSMRPTGREIVRLRTGSGTFVDPETRSFLCLVCVTRVSAYRHARCAAAFVASITATTERHGFTQAARLS